MGGPNAIDGDGVIVTSNETQWYKISFADGTELGLGEMDPESPTNGSTPVKVVPANQGMVFRYQRQDGKDIANQGWPHGDKGWLRGMQVKDDGSSVVMNMSLSGGSPMRLCMYNNNNNYGFVTINLPGNRVGLYGYNSSGVLCGLRTTRAGGIVGQNSEQAQGLECRIVQVGMQFNGFF